MSDANVPRPALRPDQTGLAAAAGSARQHQIGQPGDGRPQSAQPPRMCGLPPEGAVRGGGRSLILGSFPSAASLEKRQYYGNPRNHFWEIVAACFAENQTPPGWPEVSYGEKLDFLDSCGIILWDMVESCERTGSLDDGIRDVVLNPVADLLATNPRIMRVGMNGGYAASRFVARYAKVSGAVGAAGNLTEGRGAGAPENEARPLCRAGDYFVWLPRRIIVARLPSSSPVPSANFRSAENKKPVWKKFFTIHL